MEGFDVCFAENGRFVIAQYCIARLMMPSKPNMASFWTQEHFDEVSGNFRKKRWESGEGSGCLEDIECLSELGEWIEESGECV
jgi:hypothetical protein